MFEVMTDVLIVDDKELFTKNAAQCIERKGYHVDIAFTGSEAIRVIPDQDIAILDVDLPGPSGWDIAERVSKEYPNIHRIMISGVDKEIDEAKMRVSLYDKFISKPFQMEDLISAINNIDIFNDMPITRALRKLSFHINRLSDDLEDKKHEKHENHFAYIHHYLVTIDKFSRKYFWIKRQYDNLTTSQGAIYITNAIRGLSLIPSEPGRNYKLVYPTKKILTDIIHLINSVMANNENEMKLAVSNLISEDVPIIPEFGDISEKYIDLIEDQEGKED